MRLETKSFDLFFVPAALVFVTCTLAFGEAIPYSEKSIIPIGSSVINIRDFRENLKEAKENSLPLLVRIFDWSGPALLSSDSENIVTNDQNDQTAAFAPMPPLPPTFTRNNLIGVPMRTGKIQVSAFGLGSEVGEISQADNKAIVIKTDSGSVEVVKIGENRIKITGTGKYGSMVKEGKNQATVKVEGNQATLTADSGKSTTFTSLGTSGFDIKASAIPVTVKVRYLD
ncbi:MAG: hypothetical protein HQM08_18110 [Candidatus Riflebacteria bacterium]|nr:hypothetical protein [Candidatus Riflebacteria bacterium]